MARVSLPQSKIKARRRKRRIRIASIAAGAFVAVFLLLVWLSHAPFMLIDTVTVSGNTTINDSDIQQATLSDISGSYLYLFPKNNILLYPKFDTEDSLLTQIPTIEKVSLNAKDFHTLNVTIVERARKALWCGKVSVDGLPCFWLDEDGVAYAPVFDLSIGSNYATSSYQKYYGTLVGDEPQHYLTADQFHSLSALVDALAQNQTGNPVKSIETDDAGTVRVTFANDFVLIFSLSSAGADVYERFELALKSDAFLGHTLSDFQYLDLRFGDKLYYKLKAAQ